MQSWGQLCHFSAFLDSLIVGSLWSLLTCANTSWKGEKPSFRVPDFTCFERPTIESMSTSTESAFNTFFARNRRKTSASHEEQKPKCPCWYRRMWALLRVMRPSFHKTSGCVLDLEPKSRVQSSHFEIKQARVLVSFKSHLGKTKAFAMFIFVLRKKGSKTKRWSGGVSG